MWDEQTGVVDAVCGGCPRRLFGWWGTGRVPNGIPHVEPDGIQPPYVPTISNATSNADHRDQPSGAVGAGLPAGWHRTRHAS